MKRNKVILFVIMLLLVVVATLFDYEITDQLNGHFLVIGRFFEVFGELPYTISIMCGSAYFVIINKNKYVKKEKFLKYNFFVLLGYAASLLQSLTVSGYLSKKSYGSDSFGNIDILTTVIAIVFAVVVFNLVMYFISKVSEDKLIKYKKIAIISIVFPITVLIITSGIKVIWGRPRYWLVSTNLDTFNPWYQIAGPAFDNAHMSFLSGHTANSFAILSISLLELDETSKNRKILFFIAIIWGSITGVSRLLVGQHYLSDVVFGAILSLLVFSFYKKILKIK